MRPVVASSVGNQPDKLTKYTGDLMLFTHEIYPLCCVEYAAFSLAPLFYILWCNSSLEHDAAQVNELVRRYRMRRHFSKARIYARRSGASHETLLMEFYECNGDSEHAHTSVDEEYIPYSEK